MPSPWSRSSRRISAAVLLLLLVAAAWFWLRKSDEVERRDAPPVAQKVERASVPTAVDPPVAAEPAPVVPSRESQRIMGASPGQTAAISAAPTAPAAPTASALVSNEPAIAPAAAPSSSAPSSAAAPAAEPALADILGQPGVDLSDPAQRARVVAQMNEIEQRKKQAALAKADKMGFPKRIERPDGTVQELVDFDGDQPIYATTQNVNAAISTGANLLPALPYAVNGAGFTVGVWDGGSVRATHQEFGGRVTVKDGAATIDHSTHVGGTIAAAGTVAAAKGMATALRIDSYDWNSDKSEMTARGASYPAEPGTIYLSNHSYGYIAGWNYTGKASPVWDWWGAGTTSTGVEDDFGKYSSYARDGDSLEVSLPYYLILRSAGNDRADNPSTGQSVTLSPNGSSTVSYDPALHPAGDGVYKGGGYDSIEFDAVAKNVLTVGAVFDAVSGGVRAPANGTMTWFSSWGPTDDGRIKPDLVANGYDLYSSFSGSDTAYGSFSGTSMACPNATGSAALVISFFDKLFPSHAMRASTLKALLLHTADDLGTAGPDYQNGWGLMNVKAAADVVQAYKNSPGTQRIIEDRVATARTSVTHSFTWNGTSPLRATLCWTDPAGAVATSSDLRTARLVNDLDLQLVGPGGSIHQPFAMPYVGDWTSAKLTAAATPGANHTDNVEQVFVANPPAPGVYQAVVSFTGTLTNGAQNFSLILSGGVDTATAPAPSASAVSPVSANAGGSLALTITGANLLLGAEVKLTKTGQADVPATGVEIFGDSAKARVNTAAMAAGAWNVVITNPDGQSATLANSFSIIGALAQDSLESGAIGWTHSASTGTDSWALSTAQAHSPTHSFFAAGPASKNVDELYAPAISIPTNGSNLQLTFWHSYDLQSGRDGGVLEFSINSGAWFDVVDATSGASFATGGYGSTLTDKGKPSSLNPLSGRRAWSGKTSGFTQVVINLTDAAKYAGKSLRVRWRLATDGSTASAGWYVDDLALVGAGTANLAPSIVTAAAALPLIVTAKTVDLSVAASDDAGEPALTYSWSVNDEFTAPIVFSVNGTNAAKSTTATFSKAGLFTFTVTVRDAEGLTATSSVDVQVDQTFTSVSLLPASISVGAGSAQQFTATALDQFGNALAVQPAFAWSVSGGGAINAGGLFTAGTVPGGPFTITATSGAFSATANVTVTGQAFAAWQTAHFTAAEITAGLAADSADPDGDGFSNLVEYALGSDPRSGASPGALVPAIVPDNAVPPQNRLTLTFTRPKALPDVSYKIEVTGDIATWTEITALEITSASPTTESVTARDPVTASSATQRFMHLRATRTVAP